MLWLVPAVPMVAAGVIALLKQPRRKLASSLAIGSLGFSLLVAIAGFAEVLGGWMHGHAVRETVNFTWVQVGSTTVDLNAHFSDVETSAANATFTVDSSFAGVHATIDPTTHVLTITGDSNFNGSGNITIKATDTGDGTSPALSDSQTFKTTVNPVNDAPTLSPIADQSFNEDGSTTVDLNAHFSDVETSAAGATFTAAWG